MTKYYRVTEKELNQIKNDCVEPMRDGCEGCKCWDGTISFPCLFKGANALMDEVIERGGAENEKYKPLVDAMQEFVDRCERGEIRSKYTYTKFKELLKGVEEE